MLYSVSLSAASDVSRHRDILSSSFLPQSDTQHLPLRIKVRTPRYRKMPSIASLCVFFLSYRNTWHALSQGRRHHSSSRRHQTNWTPGGAWNAWLWETIGHLETSAATLVCEIGVGNFWWKETGGRMESKNVDGSFKQSKQQVYKHVIFDRERRDSV